MGYQLLVVESPAKAGTIKKYLGSGFTVVASYGHVRDLLAKNGAVEPDNHFAMHFVTSAKNRQHIDAIAKALSGADKLLLATDPDREGEAIAWHILEVMREKKLLKDKPVERVVFHEITKQAIQEAIKHPRQLSMDLVDAQLARRALDYLVGFNLSPLLWRKIRFGLSAGRVQSPALRLLTERQREIAAFKPKEYWDLTAQLATKQQEEFTATLVSFDGKKLKQFDINNEEKASEIKASAEAACKPNFSYNIACRFTPWLPAEQMTKAGYCLSTATSFS